MLNNIFGFTGPTIMIGDFTFTFSVAGILEIIIFAVLFYFLLRWIKRTNSWAILKGVGILVLVYVLSNVLGLTNFTYLFRILFSSLVVAIIVIFQPEIRKGLQRIGENNLLSKILPTLSSKERERDTLSGESIDSICHAMELLGKNKVGALILVERDVSLENYCNTGISLDAKISASLLEQIFEHNTPLHDGAVVVSQNRIAAATCYLPLTKRTDVSKNLGTRHRAGIGASEETDCIALIASEETGALSISVGGRLEHNITPSRMREVLTQIRRESKVDKTGRTKRSLRMRGGKHEK